jgi:hypothetical protein
MASLISPIQQSWVKLRRTWWCGMELGKVEAIQALRPAAAGRSASDVMPAFAVEGVGRMQDDSYGGDANAQDRGMEEETAELVPDADRTEGSAEGKDQRQQVNLFA